jgi:hypothetical protein
MKPYLTGMNRQKTLFLCNDDDRSHPMSMQRPESSAGDIATRDRQLSALLRAARAFEALDQRIQAVLSEPSRGRVRVACVDQGRLVLSTESAAWATRARLEADVCLQAAREVWPQDIESVRVIVQRHPG